MCSVTVYNGFPIADAHPRRRTIACQANQFFGTCINWFDWNDAGRPTNRKSAFHSRRNSKSNARPCGVRRGGCSDSQALSLVSVLFGRAAIARFPPGAITQAFDHCNRRCARGSTVDPRGCVETTHTPTSSEIPTMMRRADTAILEQQATSSRGSIRQRAAGGVSAAAECAGHVGTEGAQPLQRSGGERRDGESNYRCRNNDEHHRRITGSGGR